MMTLSYDHFNFPFMIFHDEVLFEIVLKAGKETFLHSSIQNVQPEVEVFLLDHLN